MSKPELYEVEVTIKGVKGGGKTTLLWLMRQYAETFGALVLVNGEDTLEGVTALPIPFRPGHCRNMVVKVTTETVEREDD